MIQIHKKIISDFSERDFLFGRLNIKRSYEVKISEK